MAANVGLAQSRLNTIQFLGPAALAILLGIMVQPRGAHVLFGLFALLLAAGVGRRDGWLDMVEPRGLLLVLLPAVGYLVLNSLWAPRPLAALGSAGLLLIYVLLAQAAVTAIDREDTRKLARCGNALVGALALGAAFVAFEGVTQQAILRTMLTRLPLLRPSEGGHVLIEGGVVTSIAEFLLKRNCTALLLCLWPALLVLATWKQRTRAVGVALALLGLTGIAVRAAHHDTSLLALMVSLPVFALACWRAEWVRRGLIATWLIATLLVVPIAQLAYGARLYTSPHVPSSGQARIILWGFTASEVSKSPWLGTGIGGAKAYFERHLRDAPQPPDHVYPLTTGPHAHDVYLQTWYELGLVGALLLLACGLGGLGWIGRQPAPVQPYALAGFAAAAVTGALSWGLWQEWFQALLFLSMVLMRLASALSNRHNYGNGGVRGSS